MTQTFQSLRKMLIWNIELNPKIVTTVVAEDDAYKPEEADNQYPWYKQILTTWQVPDPIKGVCSIAGFTSQEKHLLAPGMIFDWYRDRERELKEFFIFQDKSSPVYCEKIAGLIKSMGLDCDATEWSFY